MYIHLGNDILISSRDLISIVNIENKINPELQDIIDIASVDKKIKYINKKNKHKSLVICDDFVYLSPISSTTLAKRAINYLKGDTNEKE